MVTMAFNFFQRKSPPI